MTKLDSNYWGGNRRFGNMSPGNGGGVRTTNPQPQPGEVWRPENGQLQPSPGAFVGSEPGGPSSGEPIDPNRGGRGI
jgi:hypothetical protein